MNYIINYISGLSDDLNISYSSMVLSGKPSDIYDYKDLNYNISRTK